MTMSHAALLRELEAREGRMNQAVAERDAPTALHWMREASAVRTELDRRARADRACVDLRRQRNRERNAQNASVSPPEHRSHP